jgi:PAS domain S-box-containing protein
MAKCRAVKTLAWAQFLLLFCVLLFNSSLAYGSSSDYSSDYIFQVWQTDQGLPENSATAMVQTPDGYLWFGTFNGLVRFDGVKFTVFDRSNTPDLPSPGIVNLYLDRSDRLWVSTLLGTAYVKDGHWRVFNQQDGWTGDYVWRFAETSSGDIYLTTFDHKILRFDGDRFHEIVRPPVANPELGFQPYVDGTNDFWVINPQFIGKFARGKWQELIPAPSPMIEKYRFLRPNLMAGGSRDGGLWIVTTDYLRKYHSGRLMFETRAPWTLDNLWSLYEDSSGGVWITSWREGLYHFSAEQGWQHFTTDNGLPYNGVRFVFEDREHNLWVGTNGGGLARFKHRYLTNWGLEQGMPDRVVKSLTVDGKGRMYFGTWGQGVGQLAGFRITRILGPHENLHSPDGSCRNLFDGLVVSTLVDHKGRFWVSTYASGLFLFENHTCHGFFVSANSNSPQLAPIFEDHRGTIWVGTQDGAFAFDGTQFRKYFFSPRPEHSNASSLAEDGAGKILWVANRAGGLYRFDGQNLVPVPEAGVLANDRISTLFADPDSTLWIGTEDAGIACVRKGLVTRISEQQGLPAHSIASILDDEVGNLWFGSNRGILRAGRKELEELISGHKNRIEFQVFNQSDGMGVAECSLGTQPTVVKDPRGRLWFATFKGAVMVDPKSLRLNTQPPPLVIEQVLVDDQPVAGRPAFATSAAEFPLRVTVPPGDHRLEIHYAALSFTAPEKVRFRTMLEGFDKEWIEVGDRRAAYVQHMKPGKYRFRLKAANNDGIWNETGTIAELYFRPHFYETYWFYASCLLGAVAVGASLHRWRVRGLWRQEKKLRDVIETMPTFAWTILPDGTGDFVNRHWHEYTGLSVAESVGSGWQAAVHPTDLKLHLEKWHTSLASGEPFQDEVRYRRADGQYRWFLARAVPLRDERGKIVKWYGISTDIEDRKRAEQEHEKLRQLEADLAHVNRVSMLGEMAASLAHEIKQPIAASITSANSCIEWLAHEPPNLDRARAAATRIDKYGNRASEIINRLRSLYSKSPPQRELIDVNGIIEEILTLLKCEADRYSVAMRTDLVAELPKIMADRVQLQQVFMNLMLNAIEAMQDSGGELTVKSELQDGQLQFSVSDTGVGLPTEGVDQMFSAFFTTKPQGSGMGLAISRSIVESHGGRLWATANDRRGATFHFTLPIKVAESSPLVA